MFCASRDGPRKSGFLTAAPGKAGLGEGYWNPKGKLKVTTHISEIIKLQFGKKKKTLYVNAF